MYGESRQRNLLEAATAGLSPRVRGIPTRHEGRSQPDGSIPACTGNPPAQAPYRFIIAVYPRVYGESHCYKLEGHHDEGLSPRVRGILAEAEALDAADGSIPACTGNPRTAPQRPPTAMVYPRVYGESELSVPADRAAGGLSPRVRGIPRRLGRRLGEGRSIPACTGNPRLSGLSATCTPVYPRVYGESRAPRT